MITRSSWKPMNITTRFATVVSITALTCLFSSSKATSDDESWDGEEESSCESETALTLTYENHQHRLSVEAAEEFASPSFTAELESSLCHDFDNALSAFAHESSLKMKTENDLGARIGIARLIAENNTDSSARETIDYMEIEVSFKF